MIEKEQWINKIHQGDVLEVLKQMPNDFVDMVITSPPYWGHRDYGVQNQIGLEEHPQMYVDKIVEVGREIKRVLKPTGSYYLNLGDTYFGGNLCVGQPEDWESISTSNKDEKYNSEQFNEFIKKRNKLRSNWLQPKQLLLIPSRVAIGMQEDGWILRNDIIWEKINPMPSSAKDRRCNSYEHLFFFTKSQTYYFDMDVIREPYKEISVKRIKYPLGHIRSNAMGLKESTGYHCDQSVDLNPLGKVPNDFVEADYKESKFSSKEEESKHRQGFSKERNEIEYHPLGRHPRDVISIPTESFPDAHFATFGANLITGPIKSSSPEFVCRKCGKIKEKITKSIGYIDEASGGVIKLNDDPYAVQERTGFVPIRDLPSLNEVKDYLNKYRNQKGITVEEVEEQLKSQSPHHWFSGESYPTKDDWIKIKELLNFDDTYDKQMMEVKYKPAEKLTGKYKEEFISCDCNAGFNGGIVLDPFMGSGTTAIVAKELNRCFIGIELNPDYIKMAEQRVGKCTVVHKWITKNVQSVDEQWKI